MAVRFRGRSASDRRTAPGDLIVGPASGTRLAKVRLGWEGALRVRARPRAQKDADAVPHRPLAPSLAAILVALAVAGPARAVAIEWVYVGAPGNAPDDAANCHSADCGSVPYGYYIGKYEVTVSQYAEFLNAVAVDDSLGLSVPGGVSRHGVAGGYTYTVAPGAGSKPAGVWWDEAMRFANWLSNGQGNGGTETGAYTLLPGSADDNAAVVRNAGALTFLASENEWYKAAYYDAALGAYHDYATGTDAPPTCTAPTGTPNAANCAGVLLPAGNPTYLGIETRSDVGAYAGSASPYGTFDQAGNAAEWNDSIVPSVYLRGLRGGHWGEPASDLAASVRQGTLGTNASRFLGFRVVSLVPEPGTGLLVAAGLLGLASQRGRRTQHATA